MPSEPNRPRPQEQEAIRTTIVGGRPPGCGKAVGGVPRGIEVLVKKAAVDPEFRSLLLADRGHAARSIGLELSAAESMMLSAVPAAQLRSIIAATTVPQAHMPALLGKVAAVMLAALGIVQAGCDDTGGKGKPAGIRPEDQPKDNPAAASRPAEVADAQQQVITVIAGVMVNVPVTRPATQPTQSVPPVVAGVMIDRPAEVRSMLGLRDDTSPVAPATPADAQPRLTIIGGAMLDKPPARPAAPPTDFKFQPSPTEQGRWSGNITINGALADRPAAKAILGDDAVKPLTRPATQPADPTRIAGIRPTEVMPVAGATARPPEPVEVAGARATRPENVTVLGILPDKPTRPATQPTTEPATTQPSPNIDVFGLTSDRPQDTAIRGLRADTPRVAPPTPADDQPLKIAGVMADKPQTRPATQPTSPVTPVAGMMIDRPPEPVDVAGLRADRPENVTILGLLADVPLRPTTQPTTQPAAESPQPMSVTIYGMITDRPAVIKGIRVDRPDTPTTVPTTKPAAQSEPLPDPDFPIAIDGIRPDRPKPNNP